MALAPSTVVLLGAGGVVYWIGLIFHISENLPLQKAVWHGFVRVAATLHDATVCARASPRTLRDGRTLTGKNVGRRSEPAVAGRGDNERLLLQARCAIVTIGCNPEERSRKDGDHIDG
jgi:hypothetical protein